MADELTATGLNIDDYETRRTRAVAALRAGISAILDCSPEQPTGQLVDILLERVQAVGELLQALHAAIDPDQATGQSLDAVCSITGTYREPATYGTVVLAVSLNAATFLPAGSIAAVSGDPDNQWITTEDELSVGAGVYFVNARATETGPIQAPAGSISVIVTPVVGWTGVTNAADAVAGESEETDTALRLRREIEITIGGSTSVDAIRAAVSQIDGVIECYCYENDLLVSVAPMPPKSVEVVYWDGGAGAASPAEIAETVFNEKAGGIQAYGTHLELYTDDQGNTHWIGMTLAAEQRILINVTVVDDGNYVVGTVEDALEQWALGDFEPDSDLVPDSLTIGQDVYLAAVSAVAMLVDGVENVTVVQLAIFPAAPAAADVAISARQIATIDSADVNVTVI